MPLPLTLRCALFTVLIGSTCCAFADTSIDSVDHSLATMPTLPLTDAQAQKLDHLFHVSVVGNNTETDALPPEHVVWNRTPIHVTLPVGKERMITFPESVSFGYNQSVLTADKLAIQNNNGTLYLRAKSPFATQRVAVKDNASGQIILLNLSAQPEAATTPLAVVYKNQPDNTSSSANTHSNNAGGNNWNFSSNTSPHAETWDDNPTHNINFVSLTRFAAQQLYAPKRLLTQPGNIYRTPMHTYKTVPLLRDGSVIAMPLASWREGSDTVTAVLLRNNLKQPLNLDPRTLCGQWQAATFFPNSQLAPAGQLQDSTTAFLIAQQSFATALHDCLAGV